MLILPAIQLANQIVRLPIEPLSALRFCEACATSECSDGFKSAIQGSPTLLAFTIARMEMAAISPKDLELSTILRATTKLLVHDNSELQLEQKFQIQPSVQQRLLRFRSKPNVKRFSSYIAALTGMDKSLLLDWCRERIAENFNWEIYSEPDNSSDLNSRNELESIIVDFWQLCHRFQLQKDHFCKELEIQKRDALKQLAYGASHEINNPLANIATRAQTLLASESFGSKKEKLATIYAQAMRAHEMISDMMLFARPPEPVFESANLKDVIESAVVGVAEEMKRKEIEFRIRQYPKVVSCEVDSGQIAEAALSIIRNSIFHSNQGGRITVQIYPVNSTTMSLAVVDNGPGVAAELKDSVFDPFFSGREAGRGLGFGLSKAWRIFELHNGSLKLDEDYHGGARFVVKLPVQQLRKKKVVESNAESRVDFNQRLVA